MSKFIKLSKLLSEDIYSSLKGIYEEDDTVADRATAIRQRQGAQKRPSRQPIAPPVEPMPEHWPGKLEVGSLGHMEHFAHPDTRLHLKAMDKGANDILHATSNDGRQYVVKPHTTINSPRVDPEHWNENGHVATPGDWEEPEHWAARNTAANRVLDSMGMSHMGVHTFGYHGNKLYGPHQVSEFNPNAIRTSKATPEQLAKIDAHHRLSGLVHGILTNNPDGHHGNIMIDTKNNHPVHIADNDLSFASRMQRRRSMPSESNPEGHQSIMSVYGPGESLDYRRGKMKDPETGQEREMGEIGHNYPPHIMNTLHMAAAGRLGHGLSDEDHASMIKNAGDLLHHGLEGTMARRNMIQTYAKQKEAAVLPDEKTTKLKAPAVPSGDVTSIGNKRLSGA